MNCRWYPCFMHRAALALQTTFAALCQDHCGCGRRWFWNLVLPSGELREPSAPKNTCVFMWRKTRGREASSPHLDKFSASLSPFRKDGLPIAPKTMSCIIMKVFLSSYFCWPCPFMVQITWQYCPWTPQGLHWRSIRYPNQILNSTVFIVWDVCPYGGRFIRQWQEQMQKMESEIECLDSWSCWSNRLGKLCFRRANLLNNWNFFCFLLINLAMPVINK